MSLDIKLDDNVLKSLKVATYIQVFFFKIKFLKLIIFLFFKNFFFSKKNSKTVENVQADYNSIWQNQNYFPNFSKKNNIFLKYKDKYYLASSWDERKFFYNILKSILSNNIIKSVLEVGCGNGILINTLARKFRDIDFYGVDLTSSGIEVSEKLKDYNYFKEKIGFYFDSEINLDYTNNLNFTKGSILNYNPQKKFSLIFSTLALEQMESIQFSAIEKITSLSNNMIVLFEPFKIYNNNFLSKNYHHFKNYFTLEKKDIEINGFKTFDTFILPSKIYRQVGTMILKKLK